MVVLLDLHGLLLTVSMKLLENS